MFVNVLNSKLLRVKPTQAAATVRYPGVVAGQPLPRQTHFARRELSGLPVRTIRWGAYTGEATGGFWGNR